MRIALYYPWLYVKSGAERTIAELVARSRHEWTIYTNRYDADSTYPEFRALNIVELSRVSVRRSIGTVARVGLRLLTQSLPLRGEDALLVVCEGLGDYVTFRNHHVPVACLCLTPLRPVFDPYYRAEHLRQHGSRWHRMAFDLSCALYRFVDRRAWRHYRKVFAISREVRGRVLRGGLCGPEKIEVAYPGIDPSRLVPSDVYDSYFLIPGRIMWTKNLELGIDAFLDLLGRRPDLARFRLVIAGFVDEKSRPYIRRLRERSATSSNIEFVESPSDEDLFALYRSCYAVLYPPFNEDWGIVPLEGMALKKPVIAVDRGGPRESVIHGETGLLVPPEIADFSSAMERLADSPSWVRAMGERSRAQAERFSWSGFCSALDDSLDSMVPTASRRRADATSPHDDHLAGQVRAARLESIEVDSVGNR